MPDTTGVDLIKRAAQTLRHHVADLPVRLQADWTHDTHEVHAGPAGEHWVANALHEGGDEVSSYIALTQPRVALALVALLEQVAWLGALDPDLLHRVGHPELITVARTILGEDTNHG